MFRTYTRETHRMRELLRKQSWIFYDVEVKRRVYD